MVVNNLCTKLRTYSSGNVTGLCNNSFITATKLLTSTPRNI